MKSKRLSLILFCILLCGTMCACGGRQNYEDIIAKSVTYHEHFVIPYKVKNAIVLPSLSIFSDGNFDQLNKAIVKQNSDGVTYETEITDKYLFIKRITQTQTDYYMIMDNINDKDVENHSRYIFFGMGAKFYYGYEEMSLLLPYQYMPELGYKVASTQEEVKQNTDYAYTGTWKDIQDFYKPFLNNYVESIDDNAITIKINTNQIQILKKDNGKIQLHKV